MDAPVETPSTPTRPLPSRPHPSDIHTQSSHTPTPSRLEKLSRTLSTLISPSSTHSSLSYSAVSVEDDMASSAVEPPSPNLATSLDRGARRRSWGLGPPQGSPPWDPLNSHMDIQSDDPFSESYVPSSQRHNYGAFPDPSTASLPSASPQSLSYVSDPSHHTNTSSGILTDLENPLTPNQRRRTLRYSVAPSPLKKTGTVIQTVTKNLRRASMRVVNLHNDNTGAYGRMDDDGLPDEADVSWSTAQTPGPLRGRTLGLLGPQNPLRLFLYALMHNEWTEAIVLVAIIVNASSYRNLFPFPFHKY